MPVRVELIEPKLLHVPDRRGYRCCNKVSLPITLRFMDIFCANLEKEKTLVEPRFMVCYAKRGYLMSHSPEFKK